VNLFRTQPYLTLLSDSSANRRVEYGRRRCELGARTSRYKQGTIRKVKRASGLHGRFDSAMPLKASSARRACTSKGSEVGVRRRYAAQRRPSGLGLVSGNLSWQMGRDRRSRRGLVTGAIAFVRLMVWPPLPHKDCASALTNRRIAGRSKQSHRIRTVILADRCDDAHRSAVRLPNDMELQNTRSVRAAVRVFLTHMLFEIDNELHNYFRRRQTFDGSLRHELSAPSAGRCYWNSVVLESDYQLRFCDHGLAPCGRTTSLILERGWQDL